MSEFLHHQLFVYNYLPKKKLLNTSKAAAGIRGTVMFSVWLWPGQHPVVRTRTVRSTPSRLFPVFSKYPLNSSLMLLLRVMSLNIPEKKLYNFF